MHRLWDSDMIQREGDDEDFWLADLALLDTPANREAAMRGSVEDWATESLLAARAAYRVPETGMRIKPGQKLADSYQEANLPRSAPPTLSGWRSTGPRADRGVP